MSLTKRILEFEGICVLAVWTAFLLVQLLTPINHQIHHSESSVIVDSYPSESERWFRESLHTFGLAVAGLALTAVGYKRIGHRIITLLVVANPVTYFLSLSLYFASRFIFQGFSWRVADFIDPFAYGGLIFGTLAGVISWRSRALSSSFD